MTVSVSLTEVRNALRCPRIFALGRAQRRPVAFPVVASSLGAAFQRIVHAFASSASRPPRALAELSSAADEETVANAIGAVLLDAAAAEIEQNPGYASMPAEVDDLAEALRELARYFSRELKRAGGRPADALARLPAALELALNHAIAIDGHDAVVVTGGIDALQAPGTGAVDVLEYKLNADGALDRVQVALYGLLLRARSIDAEPVVLRFQPQLTVTRLTRGESDTLMQQRLVPLLREMADWSTDGARAPGPEQSDLCPSCPVRAPCAMTYPAYLASRDQPPASATRPLPDAKGESLQAPSPTQLLASQADDGPGYEEAEELRQVVERSYRRQGVAANMGEVRVGPRIISLEVRARRIPVRQIDGGAEEVLQRLEAKLGAQASYARSGGMRRFEVARRTPRPVLLTTVLDRAQAFLRERPGRFVLGEDIGGAVLHGDLSEPASCHLLVAGVSGSGKSVLLGALIASLAHYHGPEAIRFTLIDPRRASFAPFRSSLGAHLEHPLCFEPGTALEILDGLVHEMEERYQTFEQAGVDDLDGYNESAGPGQGIARHVVVVDEFSDLVASSTRREAFLSAVQRLCAKARAAGIHLVLSTERPDAKTVPSVLKTNLVGRIALKLADASAARLVLGHAGAENLLGKGDLYADFGAGPIRGQAAVLGMGA